MAHFPIDRVEATVTPSYNVAPGREILAIVRHGGKNHLERLHWGLVPFWAKEKSVGSRMINARSETLATKPSFRTAFAWRRCLIPADGFFEWQVVEGSKRPFYFALPDGRPFAFAGLWESWDNQGKEPLPHRSCTILTRPASASVLPVHHRMPVILHPQAYAPWLSRENQDLGQLNRILGHQIHTELKAVPVSDQVNSVKVDRPGNIRPIGPP